MTEPRDIAEKLSEESRSAILCSQAMKSGGVRLPFTTHSRTWRELGRVDLVSGSYLTPLGLAVRTLLQEPPHE